MNNSNFINKCNKKAWKSIRAIAKATNMVAVEYAINDAILDTFGIRHFGLMKISMREGSHMMCKVYGCHTYGGNFDLLKAIRLNNAELYTKEVKAYLLTLVDIRLKKCIMYKSMERKLAA